MRKIIVTDNSDMSVHIYSPNLNWLLDIQSEDYEDWISNNTNHQLSNCSWMELPGTFNITIH